MDISLQVHIEASSDGSPIWWVESPELPGLTASACSLAELRTALDEVIEEFCSELVEDAGRSGERIAIVSERLVTADSPATAPDAPSVVTGDIPESDKRSPIQVLIPA